MGASVCMVMPLCMWHGITIPPDSYLHIRIVISQSREAPAITSVYSINVSYVPHPYHLAPVFLSSGDYHTELAFRDALRMEAYRACSTSHSPNGSLQSLLYESLGAGGKPSTWLPPGRLVEHNYHSRDAVKNMCGRCRRTRKRLILA